MMADRELQDRILQALDCEPRIMPASIGIAVRHGVVTLLGQVATLQERWAAERVVEHVRGVRAVANELEVVWSGKAARTNTVLADEVARALAWDRAVPLGAVIPTVCQGWVTLAGTVDHEHERYAAEYAIRHIAGVRGVSNVITVREQVVPAPAVSFEDESLALV